MRFAFIHQNIPAQYRGLLPRLAADPKNEVVAIGDAANVRRNFIANVPGLKLLGYNMPKLPALVGHPFLSSTEEFTFRGETLARVLVELKAKGFKPDVICCHSGWGEALYIKDVYPDVRLINYCEFFYHTKGRDFAFDPEYAEAMFSDWNLRTRNGVQLLSLQSMDAGISPTKWQASSYPDEYQSKISVIHEGVNTNLVRPDPLASVTLNQAGIKLTAKDEVITFVNRNLEPYRGFHIFMRALPGILASRPKAHVLIIGGDEVSYGKKLPEGTYRQRALAEVGNKLDPTRVHFLGKVKYLDYLRILQISSAHVYLTYPFVLSWSMLEAMAAGCVVIGSRTAPVEEIIEHKKNGLLVNFFSAEEIVNAVNEACDSPDQLREVRDNARRTIVENYDFDTVCLPQQMRLLGSQA